MRVRASFIPDIVQAGAVKGLNNNNKQRIYKAKNLLHRLYSKRTHARAHARTHARTHAHTHTHTHAHRKLHIPPTSYYFLAT